MPAVNMTAIPEGVGEMLGIDALAGGILISIFITLMVLLAIAYLGANTLVCAIGGIGLIFLFTALTWFPVWLTIVIALIGAVLIGGEVSGRNKGTQT